MPAPAALARSLFASVPHAGGASHGAGGGRLRVLTTNGRNWPSVGSCWNKGRYAGRALFWLRAAAGGCGCPVPARTAALASTAARSES